MTARIAKFKTSGRQRFKRVLGFVVVAVVLFLLVRRPLFTAFGNFLVRAQAPQTSDIIVVLAGDGYGHRILTGAELARRGMAPQVLVSGPAGAYGNYECDLAIPFAVGAGYPESLFLHAEHRARSTKTEAQALVPVLRARHYKKVLLVTSNYHTRRAGRIFRAAAPDLDIRVIAAPDEDFQPDSWWTSREAEKTFLIEWEKTVAEWFGL